MMTQPPLMAERDLVLVMGRNIKRLREEQRLTQYELAGRIGITRSKLAALEAGLRSRCDLGLAVAITAALHVALPDLFQGRGSKLARWRAGMGWP